MTGPIQIFASGQWTDSSGVTREFTEDHLEEMATGYDPAVHEAPLLRNHNTSAGNFGLFKSIFRAGKRLFGVPHKVDPGFAEEVNSGRWPKISSGLYAPDDPANPRPGKWSLREVSVVQIPGVKGMLAPQFSEGQSTPDYPCISFSEGILTPSGFIQFEEQQEVTIENNAPAATAVSGTPPEAPAVAPVATPAPATPAPLIPATATPQESAAVAYGEVERARERMAAQIAYAENKAREVEARMAAIEVREKQVAFAEARNRRASVDREFVHARVSEGRLTGPEQVERAFAILNSANPELIAFGEGPEAKSQYAVIKEFLKDLPATVSYKEFAPAAAAVTGADMKKNPMAIKAAAEALMAKAKANGQMLSYQDAVEKVMQEAG